MKPLIGTLTAGIALQDINEAVEQSGNKCEILYLSYQSYAQAEEVLTANIKRLDGIIYGGYRSYRVAPPPGDYSVPYAVLRIGRADFFELFLRAIVVDKLDTKRISVDFLDQREFFGGLNDFIPPEEMPFIYQSPKEFPLVQDILDFHLSLYTNRETDCVITTHPSIAKEMKHRGIKHYYIQPSVDTIAEAIEEVTSRALANAVTASLSVLGIVSPIGEPENNGRLFRLLTEFATTHCSHMVVNRQENCYHLITQNRYFSDMCFGYTREVLSLWLRERNITAHIGWGIGNSPSEAAENAAVALEQSAAYNYTCSFIASEDKRVTGPIGSGYCFTYSRDTTLPIQQISEKTGLSVMYIQKLKGMWDNLSLTAVGCEELGTFLHISRRSANRVLNQLEGQGYAVALNPSRSGGRGRPTKQYVLHLDT